MEDNPERNFIVKVANRHSGEVQMERIVRDFDEFRAFLDDVENNYAPDVPPVFIQAVAIRTQGVPDQ